MIEDMLLLSREENALKKAEAGQASLSEAAAYAAQAVEAMAFEKGIRFSQQVAPGLRVPGGEEQLKRLCLSLLENAVKYTPQGGEVHLRLEKQRRQARMSVENTGDGIEKEELSHVFDRFYRGDPARTKENGGFGLGLSLARATARALGGEITAESTPGAKTVFTVTFPLA
jgi:two-component system sensor histidine kinase CiaH